MNSNPFYTKFITGQIRKCQGCKSSLRLTTGEIPAAPHNLAVARMEIHQWRNKRGELQKSSKESASHYHVRLSCIQAVEPSFVGKSLLVPSDINCLLSAIHKEHLQREFDLIVA